VTGPLGEVPLALGHKLPIHPQALQSGAVHHAVISWLVHPMNLPLVHGSAVGVHFGQRGILASAALPDLSLHITVSCN